MATWNAVAATTSAILGLLEEAYPRSFGKLTLAPAQISDFSGDKVPPDGFTLCLYHVNVNGSVRNQPPRTAADGTRYRPSLAIDLQYLLTPWAANAEKQQRLLGWAMRQLEDNAILPAGLLNRFLKEPDVFRPTETVELVIDPLSLVDFTSVWDKLKPRIQTSVAYVAKPILIDSDIELTEGPPVHTRVFEMAMVRS
jgi:uncharacterized protein DUF4255